MKRTAHLIALGLLLAQPLGCSTEEPEETLPAHCNPLSTDSCLLPWPSSFYLEQDSATATGYRVAYPVEAMPVNKDSTPIDPTRYNFLDGFSTGSQILAYFRSGVAKEGLPAQDDLAGSVKPESPIWLLEFESGERVPLFAETDTNATGVYVPGLIIRPQKPLEPNKRYVVALRSSLKDLAGQPLAPPDPFRRLRDGEETDSAALEPQRSSVQEVVGKLEQLGLARDEIVLAWDFHTASGEAVTKNLLGMMEEGLSKLPAGGPEFSSLSAIDHTAEEEPHLLRQIEGEMLVPSYLASDDKGSWLALDDKGAPVYQKPRKILFRVHIPRCAEQATGPLPVLMFGHGLFAALKGEMLSDYHKALHDRLCMIEVGTAWNGLAEPDIIAIVETVILDFSKLPRITDQLQQSHLNWQVFVKLMQGALWQDPALQVGGKPVTDGKELYYYGISNGGIQGVAFAALTNEIERFVFNVSGGMWSLMMQRSSNFEMFAVLLDRIYVDPLDRLILISLSQHLWDYTDPISFARHVRGSPLPGRSPKRIVLQESKDDDQVPNMSTRVVARALGLDALDPMVEPVYGLTAKQGPLDFAFAQWNVDPKLKPPETNKPAPKPKREESAHHIVRELESCIKQMETFLAPDGRIVHTCDGPCDKE